MNPKILLVEDDPFLREGLTELLEREQYAVTAAFSVQTARNAAMLDTFALAILDVGLPDGDGVSLCREWRAAGLQMPILFLTAYDEELQIVRGLDAGGNDYVTKPFRLLELLSRIRALLRRSAPDAIRQQGLEIDLEHMTARKDGAALYLTPTEFKILAALVRNSGQILPRQLLLERIWDEGGQFIDDNTLSVHVSRLREKVGPEHIRTIRGVGYQWEDRP
ncbi:MAG: response regulator transcription factor [Clostridia bacterium]|nr:response regulator transcription factor [Clostridia bacterium]